MTTEHLRFLKKFRRRRRMVVFLRILILFLFLLQWEICADTGVVDSFIFSSPSRIITCFLKMTEDGSVFHHIVREAHTHVFWLQYLVCRRFPDRG